MPRPKVFTIGLSAADREFLIKLTTSSSPPGADDHAGAGVAGVGRERRPGGRSGGDRGSGRHLGEHRARWPKRFADTDGDLLATIGRKRRETPPVAPIVTGEVEARLIALACSAPPEGYSRWSLRLLERHVALVEELPDLDHSTIGRVLRKRNCVLI
jgi:hypothetical protein